MHIRTGLGIASKALMHRAYSASAGLTSKLINNLLYTIHHHSSLINNVASNALRSVLSYRILSKMTNVVNPIIKYLPSGEAKDTLKRLNDAVQHASSRLQSVHSVSSIRC